MRVHRQKE